MCRHEAFPFLRRQEIKSLIEGGGREPGIQAILLFLFEILDRVMCFMNWKFVLRGLIFAILVLALTATALYVYFSRYVMALPTGPTPLPPTILAPRGHLPETQVGLKEWAKYEGKDYVPVGNGFFLKVRDDAIVGITTAHSVALHKSNHSLTQIAFSIAGQPGFIAEMDTLYGEPGKPRYGRDMTVDFVLLKVDMAVDPVLTLSPDPRGEPLEGEKVVLYSGLGDGSGGMSDYPGTVMAVDRNGAWVVMDEVFSPYGMSGSPFLSEHTGKVVGMAIVTGNSEGRLMIGMHTIGSLVEKIESANDFPLISNYQP
jgi:hypothetical protein